MKIFVGILLFSACNLANEYKPLLVDQSIQLKNYNHRPSVKLKHKHKLEQLALVSETEAKKIATKMCKSDVKFVTLTHKGQLLFYRAASKKCRVDINALDGTIISKVKEK